MKEHRMLVTVAILGWLSCGVIAAGFDNAYFQRKWPICNGREDLGKALIVIPLGTMALVVTFFITGMGKYGWSLSATANEGCHGRQ